MAITYIIWRRTYKIRTVFFKTLQLSEFLRSGANLFHSTVVDGKKRIFENNITKFEEKNIISVSSGV